MNISENDFWHMTPRKFFALVKQHNKMEGGEEEEEAQPLTPQELMSWQF